MSLFKHMIHHGETAEAANDDFNYGKLSAPVRAEVEYIENHVAELLMNWHDLEKIALAA